MPRVQTIWTSPRPCSGNGLGVLLVIVTVRALLFATTVGLGGTNRPSSGDLFAGSPTKSMFRLTTDAFIAVPSEQVIPRCSVNRTVVGETIFHACASPERTSPGPVTWTSVS